MVQLEFCVCVCQIFYFFFVSYNYFKKNPKHNLCPKPNVTTHVRFICNFITGVHADNHKQLLSKELTMQNVWFIGLFLNHCITGAYTDILKPTY